MPEVPIDATRRVKLRFDKDGNPAYESVKSPESFKQKALCVLPSLDVIPIIFLPGLMGTNLKLRVDEDTTARSWTPPNTTGEGINAAINDGILLSPAKRQIRFDPDKTEVDWDGPCDVPDDLYTLDTEEAKRRGWGSVHAASYLSTLIALERSLNDQYTLPGRPEKFGNYLLPEIGMMQFLKDATRTISVTRRLHEPDYAAYATKVTKTWDKVPDSLTDEEILKLDGYYYPVWVFGYNWLRCASESAEKLIEYIDKVVLSRYEECYFRHQGQVILVTHSMGGVVGRRAAQLAPDKILGAVHGVCPTAGAPILYRRFRAGTEYSSFDIAGWGFAMLAGSDAARFTPELACAPGPLELAPTVYYPKGWLRFMQVPPLNPAREFAPALPKEDPYEEIYKKTTDECWWGMIDPALIDPAGLIKGLKQDPVEVCHEAIDTAKAFHVTLGRYVHPNTYGFYGHGTKFTAFGHITWQTSYSGELPADLMTRKDLNRTLHGKSWVSSGEDSRVPGSPPYEDAVMSLDHGSIRFTLDDTQQSGDGTVPEASGRVLAEMSPNLTLKIADCWHQTAYADEHIHPATVYLIARVVQKATPAIGSQNESE